MKQKLPTFVATSVVRGSQQGESHGGIFTINFEDRVGQQHVDWNSTDINFEGRRADRGLRGIAFDLDQKIFIWGFHLMRFDDQWGGHTFEPRSENGPRPVNNFHINNVYVDATGIYFSGLGIPQLLHVNQKNEVSEVCSLPTGTHNARPFRDGVIFNDTASDAIRYVGRDGRNQAFPIKTYPESALEFAAIDDSKNCQTSIRARTLRRR
jgi:hypothetical protein